ncbi:hypothetical protein ACFORL_01240 [Legionella dresdenensis]|uniref:Ankyrin repeat protein n=1 Tax=Legionella dresdenensis TaxID=450200 RepID=A0ABV8CCP1_9GAMM
MSKRSEQLQRAINKMGSSVLKEVLLRHFNTAPDPDNETNYFTQNHRYNRLKPAAPRYTLPLNAAFAYAPVEVCNELTQLLLTMPDSDFAATISRQYDEDVLQTIAQYAPPDCRSRLFARIAAMPGDKISEILFGKAADPAYFLSLIKSTNSSDLKILLQALDKVSPESLLTILPSNLPLLIYFFRYHTNTETANIMMALLKKMFPGDNQSATLIKFIQGGQTDARITNLLHVVLANQSSQVIRDFLQLLEIVDQKKLIEFFEQRNKENQTPLEAAVRLNKNPQAVLTIVQWFMSRSEPLKSLLTKVYSQQPYSMMHQAVNSHIDAATYFLQFCLPEERIHATGSKPAQTMRDLAKAGNNEAITMLYDALPVFHFIHSEGTPDAPSLAQIENGINSNRKLLDSRWSDNDTLLHLAVNNNTDSLTPILLQSGINAEATNKQQQTALEKAFYSNQMSQLQHFTQTTGNTTVLHAIAKTIATLPICPIESTIFPQLLEQSFENIHQQLISEAKQNNDATLFLLIEAARLAGETGNPALFNAASSFIDKNINSPNHAFLIGFLFTLPPQALAVIFDYYQPHRTKIASLIQQGLASPAVFTRLSWQQTQPYLELLKKISTPQIDYNAQLARTMLTAGDKIEQLPAPLLQYYAQNQTLEQLVHIKLNNTNPILTALALEKCYTEGNTTPEVKEQLQQKLTQEIDFLNMPNTNRNNLELAQTLNLCQQPEIKIALHEKITALGEKSLIKKRVTDLLPSYPLTGNLQSDSLLYQLFLETACQPESMCNQASTPAYSALASKANPDEQNQLKQAINTNQERLAFISSMLSPFNTPVAANEQINTSRIFFAFQRQRIHLKLITQAQNIALLNVELNHTGLTAEGSQFRKALTDLDNQLITLLMTASSPILNSTTLQCLNNVKSSYQVIAPQLPASFERLPELIDQIKDLCQQLDGQYQNFTAPLARHDDSSVCQPLTTVYDPNIPEAAQESTQAAARHLLQDTANNQSALIAKLFALTDKPEDLPDLLPSFLACNKPNEIKTAYEKITDFMKRGKPDESPQLITALDSHYHNVIDNYGFMEKLQTLLLMQDQVELRQIVDLINQYDTRQLASLRQLCKNAGCHAMITFIDLVSATKEPGPLIELNYLEPLTGIIEPKNLSLWLDNTWEQLQRYRTQVFSMSILIRGYHVERSNISFYQQAIHEHLDLPGVNINAQAISCLIKSCQSIFTHEQKTETLQSTLYCISDLLGCVSLETITEVIEDLPPETIDALIKCALNHINCLGYEEPCRKILTYIYHDCNRYSNNLAELIKTKLNACDLSILGSQQLRAIATSILTRVNEQNEKHEDLLKDLTVDCVWIQHLILSPEFMAACDTRTFQALIERYRLYSLTLKQDELDRLNTWLDNPDNQLLRDTINSTEQALQEEAFPGLQFRRQKLLEKKKRLLEFRADSSIIGIYKQFQQNCNELKLGGNPEQQELAEKALATFDANCKEKLQGLRNDMPYKLSCYLRDSFVDNKGDIEQNKNILARWINAVLPPRTLEQRELQKKQNYHLSSEKLYDEQGVHIADVDQTDNIKPIQSGKRPFMTSSTIFYNENHHKVGYAAQNGKFCRESDNMFQPETTARLLAKTPQEELSEHPALLNLLFNDVFQEKTLPVLFSQSKGSQRAWLENQVKEYIAESAQKIPVASMTEINRHYAPDELFALLNTIKNPDNAQALFTTILYDEEKAPLLFAPEYQTLFNQFLVNHKPVELFAEFLLHHHDKPWYLAGLNTYSQFARQCKKPDLLPDALLLLCTNAYNAPDLQSETARKGVDAYEKASAALLGSEKTAEIVWCNFINSNLDVSTQKVSEKEKLSGFFFKHHCAPLITKLNADQNWQNSYLYRMMLLILNKQLTAIFADEELRYSQVLGWSPAEIAEITQFIKKHMASPRTPDENKAVGLKVINKLILRCANFGQTDILYNARGRLNQELVFQMMEPASNQSRLPTVVNNIVNSMVNWFGKKANPTYEQLKNDQAIVNWESLTQSSREVNGSNEQLPIITAYLINYSGTTEQLLKLITDYCNLCVETKNQQSLYHISKLMLKLPDRDISIAIFNTLFILIKKKPEILDETIYAHLSSYYAHHDKSYEQEINLIKYLGHIKNYSLVEKCCQFLLKGSLTTEKPGLVPTVKKAKLEAKVEAALSKHQESWYFSFYKRIKRWWNYGSNKASGLVKYCDEAASSSQTPKLPEKIKTPVLSGETISGQLELLRKRRALKDRVDRFANRVETMHPSKRPSQTSTGIEINDRLSNSLFNTAASVERPARHGLEMQLFANN